MARSLSIGRVPGLADNLDLLLVAQIRRGEYISILNLTGHSTGHSAARGQLLLRHRSHALVRAAAPAQRLPSHPTPRSPKHTLPGGTRLEHLTGVHEGESAGPRHRPLAHVLRLAVLAREVIPSLGPVDPGVGALQGEAGLAGHLTRGGVPGGAGVGDFLASGVRVLAPRGEGHRRCCAAGDRHALLHLRKCPILQTSGGESGVPGGRPVNGEALVTLVRHNLTVRQRLRGVLGVVHLQGRPALHRLALLGPLQLPGGVAGDHECLRPGDLASGSVAGEAAVADSTWEKDLGARAGAGLCSVGDRVGVATHLSHAALTAGLSGRLLVAWLAVTGVLPNPIHALAGTLLLPALHGPPRVDALVNLNALLPASSGSNRLVAQLTVADVSTPAAHAPTTLPALVLVAIVDLLAPWEGGEGPVRTAGAPDCRRPRRGAVRAVAGLALVGGGVSEHEVAGGLRRGGVGGRRRRAAGDGQALLGTKDASFDAAGDGELCGICVADVGAELPAGGGVRGEAPRLVLLAQSLAMIHPVSSLRPVGVRLLPRPPLARAPAHGLVHQP
mmetsp:Transcript_2761/g.5912  ORF Transcript_2761/g.5912 Transcript_2761/m.5912 type:complete len:558 (-) Transcript_2761:507-2180(-)